MDHNHKFGVLCQHPSCVKHRKDPKPRRKTQVPAEQPFGAKKNKSD